MMLEQGVIIAACVTLHLVVALAVWPKMAQRALSYEHDLFPHLPVTDGDRTFAWVRGFWHALTWPVSIPVTALRSRHFSDMKSDREIRQEAEAELRKLRALAREHNLPGWEKM